MLEWLITIGASELGKAFFEQGLKLGQSAAEDYVKDFFKGCLKDGVSSTKPEVTKKAVAEAVKAFLLLVTEELEDKGISAPDIRNHFDQPMVQFVKVDAVKPILGKAFEKDCRAIDVKELESIWQQSNFKGQPFPPMPEDFDWPRIGGEYLRKVRKIVRDTPELRALLEVELLEAIAQNTSQLSPGFDVAKYRQSLQTSYGYLKLYTLDSTDRADTIKLWKMFIEQTVREALPPMRYELPLDLKRQLQEQGQLEGDLSSEALELYRREYFQMPSCKALEAISGCERAVILGDPGAGKSTLLQYLALEWVEGKTETLPLLIELREYAIAPTNNFLEFLHRGRGVDWQFDQQQLHQHLLDQPTLVMFDGLDEVFDRSTQAAVVDDIIRFAQQYPKAQVLVTSRIIGYNPERFQHADFKQFTIQPLDEAEIHEFIDRWYELAMGSDTDKERLKQRLKDAIANSKAIANLADNPLLLTMMAILNRRQELPRDRADLYDQASRVLLYHWDVDHKRLQLPMDAIGRREKQEMLRLIAYEMQAGEEGLKGNLISADRLIRVLTNYLLEQGFSEPREKANVLLQQLRERNFILCHRGADTYGFVHRTFLEYFCAVEIVHCFEKQRSLTFEQLRDEVFGQHWQDETWHEVLRLISGMIDANFAEKLVEFLMEREVDRHNYLCNTDPEDEIKVRLDTKGLINLILAANCLSEIGSSNSILQLKLRLKRCLCSEIEKPEIPLSYRTTEVLLESMIRCLDGNEILPWLQQLKVWDKCFYSLPCQAAIEAIGKYYHDYPGVLEWFKRQARERIKDQEGPVRWKSTTVVAKYYKDDPETLTWLKARAKQDSDGGFTRQAAIKSLAEYYRDDSETFVLLKSLLQDQDPYVRGETAKTLANYFTQTSEVFDLLCIAIAQDQFRRENETQWNPRKVMLEALLTHYPTHSKTIELLHDRAINDPDEQLREWAQQQVDKMKV